jgi:hypothetical protein
LGEAPPAWLFDRLASSWGSYPVPDDGRFHELRTYAVDGVVWSLPDTPANCEKFTRATNANSAGAWPQLRAACLMDTYSHVIRAANFDDYRTAKLNLARPLMRTVADESLTIFDRAYFSAAFLLDWQQACQQRPGSCVPRRRYAMK